MKRIKAFWMAGLVVFTLLVFSGSASAAITWTWGTQNLVDDPAGQIYTYAPSVVVEGSTEHIWTCHNTVSGNVLDSIVYNKRVSGSITQTSTALSSGASGTWDGYHICDPAVVSGSFIYSGTTYSYAMLYLGNDHSCSCNNQIGIAFSNGLSGSWVKYPNPIITHALNDGSWGVGQPSATSVDGNGRILIFYTQGDSGGTKEYRVDANLHNMSSYTIGTPLQVTNSGLTGTDGSADYMNNMDIVYDSSRDRFYAVREQHPYPTADPNYIGTSLQIVSIAGTNIWNGGGSWQVEGNITPAWTGFARNHNGGIERNAAGGIPSASSIKVMFASSCENCGNSLWSYNLWEVSGSLANGAVATVPNGIYKLTNLKNNKVLDCYNPANGTPCYTWDYYGDPNQKWEITGIGSGLYKLINQKSFRALDSYDTSNGAQVYIYDYSNNNDQQWQIIDIGSGLYKLINHKNGKALDSYDLTNGANAYTWDYVNGTDQQWSLTKLN